MLSGPDSRRIERLGEYTIHRVLGEGGMGIVYEATERLSGRRVALKVLHSSLANIKGARDRFFGEMRIMAGLEHPNIVRSLSSAEIDGKLVMVLEYVEGRNLREELVARGRLPLGLAITVASAVASALGAAHGASPRVVHRDLKPENVMLATDGRIKVMDFGIAKVLGDDETHTTQAVGTLKYMSPEQAGGGVISPQTDLYALGLLIYEMLAGKTPFESVSLLAILRDHSETPAPPLPDDVRREIPLALEQLIFQLLEKDPLARPSGALAVLDALIGLNAPQPVAAAIAERPATMPTTPRGARGKAFTGDAKTPALDTIGLILRLEPKRRWPYVVGALALVAVIAGVGVYAIDWRPKPRGDGRGAAASDAKGTSAVAQAFPCPPQGLCTAFKPATPKSVPAETILAESDQVARRLDPRAALTSARFDDAVVDGFIDTTRSFAHVNLFYAMPDGSMLVQLRTEGFMAIKVASLSNDDPFAPAACPLKRAWDVAFGPAARNETRSSAGLALNSRLHGPFWSLSVGKGEVLVSASTCALASSR